MSRRLPVYLLIDSSGSMQGEPIHAVNVGISSMLSALRQDPYALESVHLSLITFDREINEILPLTPLDQAQINDIELPKSGATHMGEGLEFLVEKVTKNIIKSSSDVKGDFRPMLFIMTDGAPSDLMIFKEAIPKIKNCNFAEIIACAAGPKANTDYLKKLTSQVVVLDNMDSSAFAQFFKWVSDSITAGSMSAGVEGTLDNTLPPPPPELQIVL
ncbi:MAG: VWA domain-containing protein [Cycloclasticus sp.]|nr:VWA domain-containing protein [Cycloclasticus sp.]